MTKIVDYKKVDAALYRQSKNPQIVEIPNMLFFAVNGVGHPNTSEEYLHAMEILYGLSYTIKMSKMEPVQHAGYFDYVVPPLEGLWWLEDGSDSFMSTDKSKFLWTSMIRQPAFVDEEVFRMAKEKLQLKNPDLDLSKASFVHNKEGLCAQIMHFGSYDTEQESLDTLLSYIENEGYTTDLSQTRKHHEIYFNDPRKVAKEKLKTIIRLPIK